MNDKHNELNDIILNRNEKSNSRKKMLIGIGTLTIVAIAIVIIMGRMSDTSPTQLPQPALPTEQQAPASSAEATAPALEAHSDTAQQRLDAVAEKVTSESVQKPVPIEKSEVVIIDERKATVVSAASASSTPSSPAPARSRVSEQTPPATTLPMNGTEKTAHTPLPGDVYIQVGSFSRYHPDARFLKAIKKSGYSYTLYRIAVKGKIQNKVLVGPFADRNDARGRLSDVRRKIERGAFIYTIKP